MGAKYILLNHFSQRYPKLPRYQPAPGTGMEGASSEEPKIALAFDLMTLPLKSFEKATSYTDAMEVLFKEDEAEGEEVVDEEAQDNNAKPKAQNKQGKGGGQKKPSGQQAKGAQTTLSGELSQNQQKKQERKEHRSHQKKAAIALAADALPEPEVISAAAGLPVIARDNIDTPSAAILNDVQSIEPTPITGEKRQNEGEDVDMERGSIKRTKSENTGVTLNATR